MGRFTLPKLDKNLSTGPGAPKWLTVLENVKDYRYAHLLGGFHKKLTTKNQGSNPLWIKTTILIHL